MKIRSLIGAACAAVAIATATAAHGVGEKVTPHFEQAIPNIPGKSLIAVVAVAHPREVSLHLRLRLVGRNRVAGE
jgi:hypothetical protein